MKVAVNSFPGDDPNEPIRYVEFDPVQVPAVWWMIAGCYLMEPEPPLILQTDDEFFAEQWAKWAVEHWTLGALPTMKRRGR